MEFNTKDLLGANKCSLRRSRHLTFNSAPTENSKRIRIIKDALNHCLNGELTMGELEDYIKNEFTNLKLPTKTRALKAHDATSEIRRYLSSEKTSTIPGIPLDIDVFGVKILGVCPDRIRVDGENIEVINFRVSKPNLENKIELYILLKYAEKFIDESLNSNGPFNVSASYYFLRKQTDKRPFRPTMESQRNVKSGTLAQFDPNFFLDENGRPSSNVVTIGEKYFPNTNQETENDKVYREEFEKLVQGIDKSDCTEEECNHCSFKNVCNYRHSPSQIVFEKKVKSINELALTTAQENAIAFDSGVCRINAGAGAGKTLVVALRTVTLLNKGVKPSEIILLTFTNTGAEEMKERIALYNEDFGMGDDISDLISTTFNSFGNLILAEEYTRFGFSQPPRVIDDVQRSSIIAKLLEENDVDGIDYRNFSTDMKNCKGALAVAKDVFNIIKSNNYTDADFDLISEKIGRRFCTEEALRGLIKLYNKYNDILKVNGLIEFADQETLIMQLLQDDPYYLDKFGFKHIIVDEFQDSSKGQIDLIKFMMQSPSFESLMVVGDDSQAIFSFRDTSPEYLIHFFDMIGVDSEDTEDIYLVDNHRSTPEIIDLANKVNNLNVNKVAKSLIATREHGVSPIVRGFITKEEEYEYIVSKIKEKINSGIKPEDIAFIAETKYELMAMANKLTEEDVPSVMLNPEVLIDNSRVIAGLELAKSFQNPNATESILTCLNAEYGGNLLMLSDDKIEAEIERKKSQIAYIKGMPKEKQKEEYLKLLESFDEEDEVFQSFIETMKMQPSLNAIFEYCNNFEEYGSKTAIRRTHDYPGVVLTTSHSSKGLEWPVVFNSISKYDEPLLHTGSNRDLKVEERRRLFFVSMTRARDELYVTGTYIAYGSERDRHYNQFLKEAYKIMGQEFSVAHIETEILERKKAKAEKRKKEKEELLKKIAEGNLKSA